MTILSPNRFRRVSRLVKGVILSAVGIALVLSLSACNRDITLEPMKLGADSSEETNPSARQSTESVIVRTAIGSIVWRKSSAGEPADRNVSTHAKSVKTPSKYRVAKAVDHTTKTDVYKGANTPAPARQGPLEWRSGTYVHLNKAPEPSDISREETAPPVKQDPPTPVRVLTTEEKIGIAVIELLQNADPVNGLDNKTRDGLLKYYAERKNHPVWVSGEGIGIRAQRVITEIQKAGNYGLNARSFDLPDPKMPGGTDAASIKRLAIAEVKLSLAAVKYVRHAKGGRINPRKLTPSLDVSGKVLDASLVLQGLSKAKNPDRFLRSYHPKHPQFEALRAKYLAIRKDGRNSSRAQRILINMEKWRWMPNNLGRFHVWLNIPEFQIRVIKNGKIIHSERAVVGKQTNKTPVFSDRMEYIVFHPYWNVPNSIKVEEILPGLRRGTRIMDRHNLRVKYNGQYVDPSEINWNRVNVRRYEFYQPPGGNNVLGFVKFMFPNRHAVYMHDTTSKKLFNYEVRMFSHGCMRIRNPRRLAEILLNEDKGWPAGEVDHLIRQSVNHRVQLSRGIPVHMTYFTTWVEDDGQLTFHQDFYGHDRRIAEALTGRPDLIPIANVTKVKVAETDTSSYREHSIPDYTASVTSSTSNKRYRRRKSNSSPAFNNFWSPE